MGLFDWLFKSSKPENKPTHNSATSRPNQATRVPKNAYLSERANSIKRSNGIIRIDGMNFSGQYSDSPNGQFTIAWRDTNEAGTQGGYRKSGHGKFVIIEGSKIISEGKIARPDCGRIADTGHFVLNDWGFGDGLKGTLRVYNSIGVELFSKRFRANLHNCGISKDGKFAVCQTCCAPEGPHDSLLSIFDIETQKIVAKWIPETGWAERYEFSAPGQIWLEYSDACIARYSIKGELLNRDEWQLSVISKGRPIQVLELLDEILNTHSLITSKELLILYIDATKRSISGLGEHDTRWRARAHKLLGILNEMSSDIGNAILNYETALRFDPKIGVKRRIEQLQQQVSLNIQ